MKILFVLSQVEVTGAETYALTLASALRKLGHEVLFVSETLRDAQGFPFFSLPLHSKNTSYPGRIQNVRALRKIVRSNGIELIHSHSRAANLVGFFSIWGLRRPNGRKVPMIVSVHGRWRNHFAARQLPCLGDHTIAVCPYLERYLAEDIQVSPAVVHMVPNGIDTEAFAPVGRPAASTLLYIGRFSGQKGNVIRFLLKNIFPELARQFPQFNLSILSGIPVPSELNELARKFNAECGGEFVKLVQENVKAVELYRDAYAVIGSGRVALEGMACGKPVVAIGESSAPGLLSSENIESAFDSNFGDCGAWNLFVKENSVAADLKRVLTDSNLAASLSEWGRKTVLEKFDSVKVAKEVEQIYRKVLE